MEKRPYVEPAVLSEKELEEANSNFPMMPLIAVSGGASDVADGTDGTDAADGSD